MSGWRAGDIQVEGFCNGSGKHRGAGGAEDVKQVWGILELEPTGLAGGLGVWGRVGGVSTKDRGASHYPQMCLLPLDGTVIY